MNKNAIKKFAIEARKKLIDSVTDKAGMLGITEKSCSEPITKGPDFEVYQTVAGTEVTLNKRQCEQRRRLVSQIESRGFEAVVEEVAYTWFNRICAIRFMEVNDYLPNRVRVLSSEKEGKMEPDLVTQAPDVDLDLTAQEKEEVINWKMSGTSEDTDKLFGKLFLKQCHQLHDILPGLFEADSDYMELLFGISYTNKDDVIYMLVNPETGIPEADFNVSILDEEGNPTGQVEIIGWLYQYYNTELKDDTFAKLKKNVKITKERIPAATQLFTPDWIVRYMVENSVGRIWIEHLRAVDPSTDEKATAERFGWKYYLPEAEQEEDVNVKLAEIRTTYKDLKPTDITCIDPCMGSGHILIAMFDVLMDIYESAGYDKREAAFEIVEHNIHGLDIDQRAYQLAYFAVMMKGRGYNRRFLRGRDGKPEPKVYAIVESNEINRNHLQFFGTHLSEMERNLATMQIEGLLDTFKDAREYGSILNVDACDWDVLKRFVDDLGTNGQISFESVGSEETQEQLSKLVRVAKNLGQKYDAVVTNPPYMGRGNMSGKLSEFVKKNYSDSKSDLYAVFIEKSNKMLKKDGFQAMITQQTWMFINSYAKLRENIYQSDIVNMAHLGARAFDEIGGEVVQTTSFLIRKSTIVGFIGTYIKLTDENSQQKKEIAFLHPDRNVYMADQRKFAYIEGAPCAYWLNSATMQDFENSSSVGDNYFSCYGLLTGHDEGFIFEWYEVNYDDISFDSSSVEIFNKSGKKYAPLAKGGNYRKWYGNRELIVRYDTEGINGMSQYPKYASNGQNYYFKNGITWAEVCMGRLSVRYLPNGSIFSLKGPTMFHSSSDKLLQVLGYLNTKVVNYFIGILNPTISCGTGVLNRLPLKDIEKVDICKVKNNIRWEKEDWDAFELSWDFKKHPFIEMITDSKLISESFRNWEAVCDYRYNSVKNNEEELNEIFIQSYNLENELSKEVDQKDITVRRADLTRDIKSFISYAVGCMFGRYSLDEEGIVYAGGNWNIERYHYFIPDEDNCIPITDEEYFSDDTVNRFVEFVRCVYGNETLEENLNFIAQALGNKGESARGVIRNYFIKDFYDDHVRIYQKKPIYWMFDSGKENGFKALIYMHRYNADTVGRVRIDYLHCTQKYIETALKNAQYAVEHSLSVSDKSKSTKLINKYTKQLAEIKIFDEAIAHIANQRVKIGYENGIKANYEKFQNVEIAQEGKKPIKINLLAKIK